MPRKVHISQSHGFSSSHVWMWEPDQKESWAPKNWCFRTVVLEKPLDSPLDCKEIKPINPKEINPEYSLEGWMLKLKLQYFVHLMQSRLNGRDPDDGKDGGQEEKGAAEDEMVGYHYWLWSCAWANSGRQWRTGKPGVLQYMESQRFGHDLATE